MTDAIATASIAEPEEGGTGWQRSKPAETLEDHVGEATFSAVLAIREQYASMEERPDFDTFAKLVGMSMIHPDQFWEL